VEGVVVVAHLPIQSVVVTVPLEEIVPWPLVEVQEEQLALNQEALAQMVVVEEVDMVIVLALLVVEVLEETVSNGMHHMAQAEVLVEEVTTVLRVLQVELVANTAPVEAEE
jgi:hypothetical protein